MSTLARTSIDRTGLDPNTMEGELVLAWAVSGPPSPQWRCPIRFPFGWISGSRAPDEPGPSAPLLEHRCGALTPSQQARIQALSLTALESLSVALLDFQGPDDFNAWLTCHTS